MSVSLSFFDQSARSLYFRKGKVLIIVFFTSQEFSLVKRPIFQQKFQSDKIRKKHFVTSQIHIYQQSQIIFYESKTCLHIIDFSNININMLSGNSAYIHTQPVGQNPTFRISINPHSDQQPLKFYHPSINQQGPQFTNNLLKAKQVKNSSQSFSTSALQTYNPKNPPVHAEDFLRIPKRFPTEQDISQNSCIQSPSKKKTFFLKGDGNKQEKGIPRTSQLVQHKNIAAQTTIQTKKQQSADEVIQKKKFFANRQKSSFNRNKTQHFPQRNRNIYRVSQTPITYHKQNDRQFPDAYQEAIQKQQKKNEDIHETKNTNNNIFVQSFGPTKKNLLIPNNLLQNNNPRNKSNLSVTPVKQNKKSTTNLKLLDKSQRPSFIPSKKSVTKFHIIKLIGSSKFSQAYLCLEKKTLSIYCLKKIKKSLINQSPTLLNQFIRKISLQFKSIHPNIIQIYDVFCDSQFVYLVQQYMEGGNMRNFLNDQKNAKVSSQSSIVQKMFNINSALYYIHNHESEKKSLEEKLNPTIHGDLRPQTILMNLGTCKISPVNPIKIEKNISKVHCYVCPEALAEQVLTPKSDIWNLGLVLFELCSHRNLFKVKQYQHQMSLTDQIVNMDFNKEISGIPYVSNPLKQLIKVLLKIRPDERLSSQQIMGSNVIKIYGLRADELQEKKHKFQHAEIQKIKIGPKFYQKQTFPHNRYPTKRENVNGKQFNIIYNN